MLPYGTIFRGIYVTNSFYSYTSEKLLIGSGEEILLLNRGKPHLLSRTSTLRSVRRIKTRRAAFLSSTRTCQIRDCSEASNGTERCTEAARAYNRSLIGVAPITTVSPENTRMSPLIHCTCLFIDKLHLKLPITTEVRGSLRIAFKFSNVSFPGPLVIELEISCNEHSRSTILHAITYLFKGKAALDSPQYSQLVKRLSSSYSKQRVLPKSPWFYHVPRYPFQRYVAATSL